MNRSAVALLILGATSLTQGETIARVKDADVARQLRSDVRFMPMTRSERFRNYLNSMFGYRAMARGGLHAEISQLRHDPKEWGGQAPGFAKRLGSGMATNVIRQSLKFGLSGVLHEDNRYLRSGRVGFWKRSRYAALSTVMARRDNGSRRVSISGLGSMAGSSFISRAWLPHTVATAGAAGSSFGIALGAEFGVNMLREFWPDLTKRFRRN